jgi:hypothetical protein
MRPTLFGEAAMADAVSTPGDQTPGANPNPAGQEPEGDKPLGENGEKALRAERSRATAAEKLVADLQAQVKQFQDAGKSAEDKQAEQAATLANERDTATVKALRYEVCEDMELPLKSARFLTGTTKAEIEEAAKAFKELIGGKSAEKPATGLPASPNAGRETQKLSGSEAGLAEARRRFPELAKK